VQNLVQVAPAVHIQCEAVRLNRQNKHAFLCFNRSYKPNSCVWMFRTVMRVTPLQYSHEITHKHMAPYVNPPYYASMKKWSIMTLNVL